MKPRGKTGSVFERIISGFAPSDQSELRGRPHSPGRGCVCRNKRARDMPGTFQSMRSRRMRNITPEAAVHGLDVTHHGPSDDLKHFLNARPSSPLYPPASEESGHAASPSLDVTSQMYPSAMSEHPRSRHEHDLQLLFQAMPGSPSTGNAASLVVPVALSQRRE